MTKGQARKTLRPTKNSEKSSAFGLTQRRDGTIETIDYVGIKFPVYEAVIVDRLNCSISSSVKSDGGGCTARALCNLGLLGATPVDVAKKLDASIDPVLARFNTNRPKKDHDRRRVGVEGQEWCYDVVRHAMQSSTQYLKKQKVKKGGCIALLGPGRFFIDGHLNRSYVDPNGDRIHHDGHDDPKYAPDSTWRHSVAVKDGRLHCDGLGVCGVQAVAALKLDADGRPDPSTSYMKRLLKVYRVVDGRD